MRHVIRSFIGFCLLVAAACAGVPPASPVGAYAITVACGTALSLPCGFTRENLPVGLQIAGPPRSEARILAAAKGLEDILGLKGITPIEPRISAT